MSDEPKADEFYGAPLDWREFRNQALKAIQEAAQMACPDDNYKALTDALEDHLSDALRGNQKLRVQFNGIPVEQVMAVLDIIDVRSPGSEPYDLRLKRILP